MPSYHPADVERRWQQFWEANKTFRTPDPGDPTVAGKPKYYILDMFPYPSGAGLHVGHPEGYTATDILARYKRMTGHHVLHPMGWDAFGLPAEEYARKTGTHPRLTTAANVNNFRRQIQSLGFSYDWDREVDTTAPDYFRWTQFIFLTLHDTYFDPVTNTGRPIGELPVPDATRAAGEKAIREYVDGHRLAYQAEAMVNWCPAMGTVLANEEVTDGRSEVGGHPVERRPLRQWLLRITTYAERLLSDLDAVDWPDSIKKMQRQWIGRSEGAEVRFTLDGGHTVEVFTTRPDTLYGATYLVLAPEHPLVDTITTPGQLDAVTRYKQQAAGKSELERTELAKTKTGVSTGAFAVNPVNNERVPVWVADYVLAGYGTGAIMAVPGHDERDFEFAKAFGLPIRTVVEPSAEWLNKTGSTRDTLTAAYTESGLAVNSGPLDGLTTHAAKVKVIATLEAAGAGARKINFKLRDWLFSRQRYWGEPFPLLHELDAAGGETGVVRRLGVDDLPLTLPDLEDFRPTGSPQGPLAKATDWVTVTLGGKTYRRETNTMPQWAGSCWYYLRYIDPHNTRAFADPDKLRYWLPVDLYVGGAEHAVLHLLYSRFWHKVLFDRGLVPTPEPFQKLVNQGMILGEPEYQVTAANYPRCAAELAAAGISTTRTADGEAGDYVLAVGGDKLPEDRVEKVKGRLVLKGTDVELVSKAEKMSKSRGNVVNPDDVVATHGADSLRLYEMFMGPLEATKPWQTNGVEGVHRFLARVWRLIVSNDAADLTLNQLVTDDAPDAETLRLVHKTTKKVTTNTEGMQFNTAISAMMELVNHLTALPHRPRYALETLTLLLAPYAPHVAEELWAVLGHPPSVALYPWPTFDPKLAAADVVEVPVQVGGKVKARLTVPADIANADLEAAALADPAVAAAIGGKPVKLVKVVPRRLVNVVLA